MQKNSAWIIFSLFLLILIPLISPNQAFGQVLTDELSVDAIAVFEKFDGSNSDIFYSFHGHSPKIAPKDLMLEWKWWTLEGISTPTSKIPNADFVGLNLNPSVAFTKFGYAIAVWEFQNQIPSANCFGTSPIIRGDILYSIWDGTSWSEADIAVLGDDDIVLSNPSIAIDNIGNGIVTFQKQQTLRDADGCPAGSNLGIVYSKFDGNDKTFSTEILIEQIDNLGSPFIFSSFKAGPEIAFNSKIIAIDTAESRTFTKHQAVAVWWSTDTLYSITCNDPFGVTFDINIPTFWPRTAIWDGNEFHVHGFIDDNLVPPLDLSNNLSTLPGTDIGISSDQFDNTKIVWVINKQSGDPCTSPTIDHQIWNALWNENMFDLKASQFNTAVNARAIDIAYLKNNEALVAYPSNNNIEWSLEVIDHSWQNNGQIDAATGFATSVASLNHDRNVVIWSDFDQTSFESKIMWSSISDEGVETGSWLTPNELGLGSGKPDIAAHTGSPTLPHAEWTMIYHMMWDDIEAQTPSSSLLFEMNGEVKELELESFGSSSLVNVVGSLNDPRRDKFGWFYANNEDLKILKEFDNTLDFSEPEDLLNLLDWVNENYPAEHYSLVLADHSLPWDSFYFYPIIRNDEPDLLEVFEDSPFTIDVLGFDSCLMNNLASAYQLKDMSIAYMVGWQSYGITMSFTNPPTVDATLPGWSYNEINRNIQENPQSDSKKLSEIFVETTKERWDSESLQWWSVTTSSLVLDPVLLENLASKLDNFGSWLQTIPITGDEASRLFDARINAQFPAGTDGSKVTWIVDLYDFTQTIVNDENFRPEIRQSGSQVLDAIEEVVVAEYHSEIPKVEYVIKGLKKRGGVGFEHRAVQDNDWHGLSVFWPMAEPLQGLFDGPLFKARVFFWLATGLGIDAPNWTKFLGYYLSEFELRKFIHIETKIIQNSSPIVLPHIYDKDGNHLGFNPNIGKPDNGLNIFPIEYGIEGATYTEDGDGVITIIIPPDVTEFLLELDATKLQQDTAQFEVKINTIFENDVIDEKFISGSINKDETFSSLHQISFPDESSDPMPPDGVPIGGKIIPTDSTSLFLIGAQMTASWLIPIIVAGTGIILVFLRRK